MCWAYRAGYVRSWLTPAFETSSVHFYQDNTHWTKKTFHSTVFFSLCKGLLINTFGSKYYVSLQNVSYQTTSVCCLLRVHILLPSAKCRKYTSEISLLAVLVRRFERKETLYPIYYSNHCSEATIFMYSCFYLFMRFFHANIRVGTINFSMNRFSIDLYWRQSPV